MPDSSISKTDVRLRQLLIDLLGLTPARAQALRPDSGLFGTMPELDSMAVAGLLTEIEDSFGFIIDDADVDGDMLATFGSLSAYIRQKINTGT
ncbi:MAG: acyl carrier protein [Alphaproteobacteria bacterium]|nr:acyl carrier protein [Alphaproteobacteria bacterium]MDE2340237.1 acyl carrier protein [Alphaproteobacteria bacterium]